MFAHTDWIACLGRRLSSRTLCNFSHAALSMAGRCAAFTSSLLLARLLPLSTTCRPMDQLSPLPLSPSQSLLLAAMPSDPCAPSSFHPSLAFGPVVLTTQVRRAHHSSPSCSPLKSVVLAICSPTQVISCADIVGDHRLRFFLPCR